MKDRVCLRMISVPQSEAGKAIMAKLHHAVMAFAEEVHVKTGEPIDEVRRQVIEAMHKLDPPGPHRREGTHGRVTVAIHRPTGGGLTYEFKWIG